MGRSLMKNAYNLGVAGALTGALEDMGRNASDIFELEPDAGLGNGGLGRLAACYMDSMATEGIDAVGYTLCYELGIFKQKIEGGRQIEVADNWKSAAESWLIPRYEDTFEIRFGGRVEENWDYFGNCHAELKDYDTVLAVPRDMLISGYGGGKVNTLRLWEAHSPNSLDMYQFSEGEYVKSMEQRTMAEVHHQGCCTRLTTILRARPSGSSSSTSSSPPRRRTSSATTAASGATCAASPSTT